MLSSREIEQHFRDLPADQLNVVLELRNLIARAAPNATEEIRSQGLVYYDAERGGPVVAGVCQILVVNGGLRLAFNLGAYLPDPKSLLRQDKGRLAKRFLPLGEFDTVPWEVIAEWISASSKFDPREYFKDRPFR